MLILSFTDIVVMIAVSAVVVDYFVPAVELVPFTGAILILKVTLKGLEII